VGSYGDIIMTGSSKIPPKEFMHSMSSQYGYVYTSSTFFIPTTEPPTTTTTLRTLLTPLSLKTPPVDTRVKPTPPSDYTRKVTTTTTSIKITSLPIVTNPKYSYVFGNTSRSSTPAKTIPGKTANITTTITTTITNIQATVPIPVPTTVITTEPTTLNAVQTTITTTVPSTSIITTTTKSIAFITITDISQLTRTNKSNTKAIITNTSTKVPGTTPTKVVTAPITYNGTIPTFTSRTYNNKSTKNTKIVPSEAKTVPQSSTASSSTKSVVMTTTTTTNNPPPQTTTQAPQENCVQHYGQCGGKDYNGPTCCVSGTTCYSYNEYYSQCIPA